MTLDRVYILQIDCRVSVCIAQSKVFKKMVWTALKGMKAIIFIFSRGQQVSRFKNFKNVGNVDSKINIFSNDSWFI